MTRLLLHENISVRLWAARFTLNIESEKARNTLDAIACLKIPLISSSAEMTIKEWEKGNLSF
ncbi:hypothetical protein D3C73_1589990 [compost metagenome]